MTKAHPDGGRSKVRSLPAGSKKAIAGMNGSRFSAEVVHYILVTRSDMSEVDLKPEDLLRQHVQRWRRTPVQLTALQIDLRSAAESTRWSNSNTRGEESRRK